MLWLALAFPIVSAIVLVIFFSRKVNVWEFVGLFGIPLTFIAITRFTTEHVLVTDTEYWGGYAVQARYYEDWDERVSCRHPIYCTASCGKDCTYTYVCGHYHAYDVDYHPPYWMFEDSNGEGWSISQQQYLELVKRWNNQRFVELNRSYHSDDGDAYVTDFDKVYEHGEITTTEHSYENRVAASHSVFNFPTISKKKAKELKLIPYPPVSGYRQVSVLGVGVPVPGEWDRAVELVNGYLGKKCKARVYVLVWRDQPITVATNQQAYWKGGNKNELIVCVGVNAQNQPQWCFPFGWTKLESVKADARDFVMKQKTLDVVPLAKFLHDEIYPHVLRRDFREFAYLVIDPPMWVVILTFVLVVGFCFGWGYWSVRNEFDRVTDRFSRFRY
jgi:hypothetical protein